MCIPGLDPITLTILAVAAIASVGSSITGFVAGKKNQKAQMAFQQQQAADQARFRQQTAKAANEDFINKAFQENLRQRQLDIKEGKEEDQLTLQAREARARAITSAGESGINIGGSPTITNLINSISGDLGRARSDLQMNRRFEFQQGQENIKGFRAEAISRPRGVRQFIPSPVSGPSVLGTILEATGGLANIALVGQNARNRNTGDTDEETRGEE